MPTASQVADLPKDLDVIVVGGGPAGSTAATYLAMKGHKVTIYEAKEKPGGLNEYGLAAYKTTDDFAAREVDWLLGIGGIEIAYGRMLGGDLSLDALRQGHDAVFLGIGLGAVNALEMPGDAEAANAVDFIAALRQAGDLRALPVGRNVVVIGGGMTAVDAAVQARLLGAENVTLAYRRGRDRMGASKFEQDLAASKGVRIISNVMPVALEDGTMVLEYTADVDGRLQGTGERIELPADQVLRAIGQMLVPLGDLGLERGKIAVAGAGRSGIAGVWAGGDCTPGEDLTVVAVAEGRDAAEDIHAALMQA